MKLFILKITAIILFINISAFAVQINNNSNYNVHVQLKLGIPALSVRIASQKTLLRPVKPGLYDVEVKIDEERGRDYNEELLSQQIGIQSIIDINTDPAKPFNVVIH